MVSNKELIFSILEQSPILMNIVFHDTVALDRTGSGSELRSELL